MFYFAFATYSGSGALGWPMEKKAKSGREYWVPKVEVTKGELATLHIVDLDHWKAFHFNWGGPLRLRAMYGGLLEGLHIEASTKPQPLLKTCATQAFFSSCLAHRFSNWLNT